MPIAIRVLTVTDERLMPNAQKAPVCLETTRRSIAGTLILPDPTHPSMLRPPSQGGRLPSNTPKSSLAPRRACILKSTRSLTLAGLFAGPFHEEESTLGDVEQFYPLHQVRFRSRNHGSDSRALAREIALRWTLSRRSDGSFNWATLPAAAAVGAPFTIKSARGTVAVLQGIDTGLWLMRRDGLDPKVKGRIWRHEIFVADDGIADVIGVRLSAALGRNMVAPAQRSAVVASILNNCGCLDDRTQVQTKPRTVTSYDVGPLMEMLAAPRRRLPVLILDPETSPEAPHIASSLAGFAHVLTVMPDALAAVGHYAAKELGVHVDAVTLCWPASESTGRVEPTLWNSAQVKDAAFWPETVSGIIRSSVGTREDWLGSLADKLARR